MTHPSIPNMRAPEISLRLRANASSPAPSTSSSLPPGPSVAPPLSRTQKAYIVSDIEARPLAQRKVCPACTYALRGPQRQQVLSVAAADECVLCAVAAGKPEAFTQPFCDFLTQNPTVFHAVEYFQKKLEDAGFTEV